MEQADGPGAVHDHDIARADMAGARAPPGTGQGLGQGHHRRVQPGRVEAEQVALVHQVLVRQEVLGEPTVLGDPDRPGLVAQVDLAPPAGATVAAPVVGRHEHTVAGGGKCPLSHFHHRGDDLMAGHPPQGVPIGAVGAGRDAHIGPADRGRVHVQQCLPPSRARPGPLLQHQSARPAIGENLHRATPSRATVTGRPSSHEVLDATTAATAARPSVAPTRGGKPPEADRAKAASSSR